MIRLNLLGNPLEVVPEGIFANSIGLERLSLGDNRGSLAITGGVFEGLERLRELTLLGVESLSADAFSGTPNLRRLVISDGALSSLPAGVFDNLSRLVDLYLGGNPIAALPEGIFANLTELGDLLLGDSPELLTLTIGPSEELPSPEADDVVDHVPLTLTDGVFDGLYKLGNLTLFSLESLTADVFAGTPRLGVLRIQDGALSTLPAGVFDNLRRLETLNINRCAITELPPGVFDDLGSLKRVELHGNSIAALPSGIFDNLSSLTELDLGRNPIAAVPNGIFANLTALETLSLGDRTEPLTLTGGVFDGLEGLQGLYLYGVASLSAGAFAGTPNLETLSVIEGTLSSLPAGVFDNLSRLTRLDISRNEIAVLPSGVFTGLTNLSWLDLQTNELAALPAGVFEGLTDLRRLDLQANRLTTLPAGVFSGLSNLGFLDLTENPGTPFILIPRLQLVGSGHQDGTVKLRVFIAEGAPFETNVGWTATGDVGGAATGRVSVPGGSLYSEPFKVTSADSRGRISIRLIDSTFSGISYYIRQALRLAAGDRLTLDLATLPSSGEQFVVDEDIPEMPTGVWSPDLLSRASFSQVGGQTAITFSHGGRIEEDGVAYTCMSSGGCEIEGTRVARGVVLVSEAAAQAELLVAGVGQFVDERTVFQEKVYNGYELGDSTATLRSVAGEITRVSFLDPGGDLVFADFSSDDPATEMVITLEGFTSVLEESPYDQPQTRYARGLATVTLVDPTDLTWLEVISLGNHIDRVDLALINGRHLCRSGRWEGRSASRGHRGRGQSRRDRRRQCQLRQLLWNHRDRCRGNHREEGPLAWGHHPERRDDTGTADQCGVARPRQC